jgi:hypothetical protein
MYSDCWLKISSALNPQKETVKLQILMELSSKFFLDSLFVECTYVQLVSGGGGRCHCCRAATGRPVDEWKKMGALLGFWLVGVL